jgi:hypothetical protein
MLYWRGQPTEHADVGATQEAVARQLGVPHVLAKRARHESRDQSRGTSG